MKKSISIIIKSIAMAALLMVSAGAHAAEATLQLTVADDTGILSPTAGARNPAVRKVADRQGIVITTPTHRYGVNGVEKR